MTQRLAIAAVILLAGTQTRAADHAVRASNSGGPIPLLSWGLGDHSMPITCASAEANGYFQQGLRLCYAFNHAAAVRSFERAAELDDRCAMAWWGIAFALGPNINAPMSPEANARALQAMEEASKRAQWVSAREQAYIDAISKRYSKTPDSDRGPLEQAFADAMGAVCQAYPDDLDAATIHAEAVMDTMPWNYWAEDGTPRPGVDEMLKTLQRVLSRDPDHPGANHYFIHAVEASRHPEQGLGAAERLGDLMPLAGHLVHMPAHIYLRLGMYSESVDSNLAAIAADESADNQSFNVGLYRAMYYSHNVHFLWYAQTMLGQSKEALVSANKTRRILLEGDPMGMPVEQWMAAVPLASMVRFGQWSEIESFAEPMADRFIERALWLFARGMASCRRGDIEKARRIHQELMLIATSEEALGAQSASFPGEQLLKLAGKFLAAELAGLEDASASVPIWREVVSLEDQIPYMEPPYWFLPARHYLGNALLRTGAVEEAEEVFREDLAPGRWPRNGWGLFGLLQSLRRQGDDVAASVVEEEFRDSWESADVSLTAPVF